MAHLIGQDGAVTIAYGGSSMGGYNPVWLAATAVTNLESVDIVESGVDQTGEALDDVRTLTRIARGKSEVTVSCFVPPAGYQFQMADGSSPLGEYCRVFVKENADLAAYRCWEGIITSWDLDIPDAPQTERIVVTCDADY